MSNYFDQLLLLLVLLVGRIAALDAAYCYRQSTGVAWSIGLFVGLSVTIVSPAKTDEPMEMPFGLWTRVGPRNHAAY